MDTLKAAHDLEASGFTRQQAEAVAKVIADTGLATVKRDVDVLKWMVGVVIVVVVAVFWQLFTLSAAVARLDERMAGLGGRMDKVETRLGAIEERLTGVEGRLGAIENRLGAEESRPEPRP